MNPQKMKQEICQSLGLSIENLRSKSRARQIVAARTTIAAAALQLYDMSGPEAAKLAGFKGHASAFDARKRLADGRFDDFEICKLYKHMIRADQVIIEEIK